MEHLPGFLASLALVLGTAAITTLVFQRLRQPVVLGYLVAGLIIGPHVAITPVADMGTVRTLSELGVILLMFSLGLEFNLHKLARLAPTAGLVMVVEVGLMMSLGYLAGQLMGWSTIQSVFAGAIVSISSTMIIAKVFEEKNLGGRFTELVYGVLIMEDLIAILLLATLPVIASGSQVSPEDLAGMLGRLGLFMAVVLVVGLLVVPRLFRAIVRFRRPETTLVASVGFCFAVAQLAYAVGYSVALGAFLAGSLIAESGAARQVSTLVRPLRDMFAAIFFVSVGMLIDPLVIASNWGAVLLLVGVVLTGKVIGVSVGAFLSGAGTRTAVRSGMSMAQIGEFSFIIAGTAVAISPTDNFLYPLAVAVSVVTAFTSPWMVRLSEPAALMVDRHLPHALQTFATLYGSWVETLRSRKETQTPGARARRYVRLLVSEAIVLAAIIVGTSLIIPFVLPRLKVLGIDPQVGRWIVTAVGATIAFPFCYGMVRAARRLALAMSVQAFPAVAEGAVDLGKAPRRALVITLEIAIVLVVGIPLVAITLPFVPSYSGPVFLTVILILIGISFWRSATDLQGHVRATSDLVVEALSRHSAGPDRNTLERVQEMLPGIGTLFPVTLAQGSPAAARSLAELNLRGQTGATVVALLRGSERMVFPEATTRLQAGDLLALTGSQDAISSARALLLEEDPVVRPTEGADRAKPAPPVKRLD